MSHRKITVAAAMLAVGVLSFAAGTLAQGRYAEIDRAEGSLNAALVELDHARDVFGGHKVSASRLIRDALGELQAGKAWAAAHGQ
jgi:hypothetical protein